MILGFAQWPKIELGPFVLTLEALWSAMLPRLIGLPFKTVRSKMLSRLIHFSLRAFWSEMLARFVPLMLGSHWPLIKVRLLRLMAFAFRSHSLVIILGPIGAIVLKIGSLRASVNLRPIGAIVNLRPIGAIVSNIGVLRVRVDLWPLRSMRLVSFDLRSLESFMVSFTWQFIVRPLCVVVLSILLLKVQEPWMFIILWPLTWIDDPFRALRTWFTLLSRLSLRFFAYFDNLISFLRIVFILLLQNVIDKQRQ